MTLVPAAWSTQATAQDSSITELTEEEQRQIKIAERFLSVLKRSPRRGTALDRIYGHHVEFGTLEKFLESLRQQVADKPEDGTGWMLLGLFESQRGEDASAIDAFRKAEQLITDDAMAPWYLGQSLLLLGQPEEAVEALERAIERRPPRADLLQIFQQLGRIHQRAQRDEEALAVWTRLEKLFPDDPRVQEQIASTLVEEGEYALALPRYEQLAELVKDDYRRTVFRLEAAELKIREKQREQGLTDFETVMSQLNPESWLHRDVRRRIEDVFLRSGDQDGLVSYYEAWIKKNPEDVDAMARLARFLGRSARLPEARQWIEKALERAPGRFELRKAFIDQLVEEQQYADAVEQYRLLSEADPGNPDVMRAWGRIVLRDKSRPIVERETEARRIWTQMAEAHPDDAVTAAQVADLYRQAGMNNDAIDQYKLAVSFAPSDPQYREYLGEYYHILKRPEDALATWKEIATEDRASAENIARLAEVYNTFGYLTSAVEQIAEACRLEAKDFSLQLRSAEYHSRAEKFDEALAYVDAAAALAERAEEHDAVITQRIEVLQASKRLEAASDELAAKLAASDSATSDDWHLLARYYAAERRWASATEAVDRAIEKDAQSIAALTTAARIAESSGDPGRAAELSRRLAEVDRRSRGDHLMNVARLESQLGRTDEALQAGRDLIVSAPGNTDNYEFYAQLCFQLGRMDEGLDTLRKAMRINPTEPSLIMSLADALSRQFRTDEAIQVYWRAFEKTEDIEDRLTLTQKLTNLYLQLNQYERLIDRFERDRREDDLRRDMTVCLAQAHQTAGDHGTARVELESLLSENTRDTNLLQQISKLCEGGGDLDSAIDYQRQLADIAPGHETEYRLAVLLQKAGESDAASEIFVRLTRREENPVRLVKSVDSLLAQGSYESVLSIVEPLLRENRYDWELMYRQAVAWNSLEKVEEAQEVFRQILALNIAPETYGRVAEEKYKRAVAKAKSRNLQGFQSRGPQRTSVLNMLNQSRQVRQACGLDANRSYYYSGSRGPQPVWAPDSYGMARMAAFGWIMKLNQSAGDDEQNSDALEEYLAAGREENAPRAAVNDRLFIEQLRGNLIAVFEMSRRLAQDGGRDEQMFFLRSLSTRHHNQQGNVRYSNNNQQPKKEPLSEDDQQLMLDCLAELSKDDDQDSSAAAYGGNITYASNGQAYVNVGGQWIPISGGAGVGRHFEGAVREELILAGREEEANAMLDAQISSAKTAAELAAAVALMVNRDEDNPLPDGVEELYGKWVEAAISEIDMKNTKLAGRRRGQSQVNDTLAYSSNQILSWLSELSAEEENEKVLAILSPALDVAVEVNKAQRAERSTQRRRRRSSSSRQQSSEWSFNIPGANNRSRYVRVQYPKPNKYATRSQLMLLRATLELLKENDVEEDLTAAMRARVQAASPDDLLYEQLMLAYVLWWQEEQDEAIELMTEAAGQLSDDPEFRLELALLHQTQGDLDTALEIVESLAPRDRQLMQQREVMALTLAERLGDVERARQAAERLFGLRLKTQEQIGLATAMQRLGLNEMAENVLSRVHRSAGNQATSLPLLMAQYQGAGKVELAQQIAHRILRTSQSPLIGMNSSGRNPMRYNNSSSNNRQQALRLLHQTGALKSMEERLQGLLEKQSGSTRIYSQLVELYQVTDQRDELAETLKKAVAANPKAAALQLQLAKHYEQTGKAKEACDSYLVVVKEKPQWVSDDLYSVRRVFQRANRSEDLVAAFEAIDLKQMGHPYYLIDLVSDMMKKEENYDIAVNMFERIVKAFPTYRSQIINRFHDAKVWKNDRIYELGKKMLIPTATEVAAQPWFGFDRIYSYRGDGTVNAMFHRMRDGVAGANRLDDFESVIQESVDEMPDWLGGKVMLALIDMKQGKTDEAQAALEELVSDDAVIDKMPSAACWLIGQQLDGHESTRELAITLFEKGVAGNQQQNQLRYSPIVRLVKVYSDVGRKADARKILLKQLKSNRFGQYDQRYQQAMNIQDAMWAAEQLQKMDYPLDALLQYQGIPSDDKIMESAAPYISGDAAQLKRQIKQGLERALEEAAQSDPDEAVNRLLSVSEDRKPGTPVLNLMAKLPKTDARETYDSQFVMLLRATTKQVEMSERVNAKLADLQKAHDTDVSIRVVRTLLAPSDQRPAIVAELVEMLKQHPLDEIPEGRRPNARQRRHALQVFPVWLVARDCLRDKELQESGTVLAEHALQAARRQIGDLHTSTLLMEWGNLALEHGDKAEAEKRWSQLLDVITAPPKRKKKKPQNAAADRATSQRPTIKGSVILTAMPQPALPVEHAAPTRVAPLTIPKFEIARDIAIRAAKSGMSELSQRAVRKMLAGGMPVPEAAVGAGLGGNTAAAFGSRNTRSNQPGDNKSEKLVADSLLAIVKLWSGPDYPPVDVYDALVPVILPESRPNDILLYADSSRLEDAELTNAGDVVIDWAEKAERLNHLTEQIQERMKSANAEVSGRVLLTNIAIRRHDLEAAAEELESLAKRIMSGSADTASLEACHAALPAFRHEALREPAYSILTNAVMLKARSDNNSGSSKIGKLHRRLNKYLADAGRMEDVNKFFDDYLNRRQVYYSRHSGDYSVYLQWQDWASIAREAALVGSTSTALDFMGRAADFKHDRYSPPSLRIPLARVLREVQGLSAEKRYEQLREWTLPTEQRRNVRFAWAHVPVNQVPEEYLPDDLRESRFPQTGVLCNVTSLIDAAEEAGQLDELLERAKAAADDEVPHAIHLLPLVQLRTGDLKAAAAGLEHVAETFEERNKKRNNNRPNVTADCVVWWAAMQTEAGAATFMPLQDDFRKALQDHAQHELLARVEADYARARSRELNTTVEPGQDPGLVYWSPSTTKNIRALTADAWWTVVDQNLVHLGGPGDDNLIFNVPLTGNFEFTLECFDDRYGESDVGFNGMYVHGEGWTRRMKIESVSGHESFNLPRPMGRGRPSMNSIRIRVHDGVVSSWINNHQMYEEPVQASSPWLQLFGMSMRQACFRNLRLTGNPVVPDEIPLLSDDRMEGWNTKTFSETQRAHRLLAQKVTDQSDYTIRNGHKRQPAEYDWAVKDGVLTGRAKPDAPKEAQSWAYYHRPMQDGETFRYEFFYTPGESAVSPTFGRLAWLLTPDGIKTRWIASSWDTDVLGIDVQNERDTDEQRPVPLKAGEWNQVQLSLTGGTLKILLNDAEVFSGPVQAVPDTRFGMYRSPHFEARIRNAVLSGPWQDMFESLVNTDLLARREEDDAVQTQIAGEVLNDRFGELTCRDVCRQAAGLSDDDAWDLLTTWVLPPATHRGVRLSYQNDIVDSAFATAPGPSPAGDVALNVGAITCPAIDLINLAARTDRLSELATLVADVKAATDEEQIAKDGMAALVALAGGDTAPAVEAIEDRHPIPDEIYQETLLCRAAMAHPELHEIALELAQRLGKARATSSKRQVDAMWTLTYVAAQTAEPSREAIKQWTNVPRVSPADRFNGRSSGAWRLSRGHAESGPAKNPARLYFQSPLQGRFEVTADATEYRHQQVRLSYGGFTPSWPKTRGKEEDDLAPQHLVVDRDSVAITMGDAEPAEEAGASPHAPWLTLESQAAVGTGLISNLRITGDPVIPDEIDLINTHNTALWSTDMYGEGFSASSTSTAWMVSGEELRGNLTEDRSAAVRESLLRYARPILEDGVISFEAYFVASEYEVHPAVGSISIVLQPDQVTLHELTDGAYEMQGKATDNAAPIDGASNKIPLKHDAWNRITLSITGDTLAVSVNEQQVATVVLTDPVEERFFGLFRYSTSTQARVRNVHWRGEWPKSLPSLEDQELADIAEKVAAAE